MMADINVTPLVDVMLVLLVVFMITAPLLTAGVNVNLPKAHARALDKQDDAPLEISLDAQGHIYIGQTRMTADELKAKLAAIAQQAPDKRIYIRADNHLSYGQVMGVMAIASTSGFTKIALVTDPSSAQGR
ncbi:MAG: protein TolR [Alphaproteobacteria bacterium]|nr:protein TolR [Alphaproteobacteria bacterium]MDE2336173.1 protein TolR [Alphaproteobacteria bacterium]